MNEFLGTRVATVKGLDRFLQVAALGFAAVAFTAPPAQAQDNALPSRPPIVADFPATAAGRLVAAHMNVLVGVGPNAEAAYQASLKRLRADPQGVTKVLLESYLKTDEERYFRRWALVETLRELGSNHALAALYQIASAPVPTEKYPGAEQGSRAKESHIRTTAVDGVAELAQRGDAAAEGVLTRFFPSDNLTLRRRAVRGYLKSGQSLQFTPTGAKAEIQRRTTNLRSLLPAKDHALISLAVTDLKKVPHPVMPEKFPTKTTRDANEPVKPATPAPRPVK